MKFIIRGAAAAVLAGCMDYMVAGNGHSINFDHCSLKHDFLDTACQKHREGK